jgi:hypothetical protein
MGREFKEGILEQTERPRTLEGRTQRPESVEELTIADLVAKGQATASKEPAPEPVAETAPEEPPAQLFSAEETARFQSRWDTIQTGFVDEPHLAVKHADGLVAEVTNRVAQIFADQRAKLGTHPNQNRELSTEDLRLALRRYRAFFARLLSV